MRAGLHVNDDRGIADAVAYCAEVQPAAMKWMDPKADTLIACRRASPKTRHIIRTHWSDQTLERYPSFINANLDRLRGLLAHPELRPDADGPVLWVEGYNEHVTKDTSTSYIRDFAGKEVKLAKAVNALGAGCLMGGCSTGFLEEVHLHAFKEVLDYCQANPKAAGFHTHERTSTPVRTCSTCGTRPAAATSGRTPAAPGPAGVRTARRTTRPACGAG